MMFREVIYGSPEWRYLIETGWSTVLIEDGVALMEMQETPGTMQTEQAQEAQS
jgi:hypothetical protein